MTATKGASTGRLDASAKASGATKYLADLELPDIAYVAVKRSDFPHARILSIDTSAAAACTGVIGVFTAADISPNTFGRSVRDAPILAKDKVRYVGERVAAVVATTRAGAERAAALIEVEYDPLPTIANIDDALAEGAALIHDAPWEYPNSHAVEGGQPNLQGDFSVGDRQAALEGLSRSAFVVDETYETPSVHHGYLETQSCMAAIQPDGRTKVWCTNKAPYGLRGQLAACFELDPEQIEIQAITLGGDFGGKGSMGDSPLCMELTRLTGRPVKIVLRYSEDLIATTSRHPTRIRLRVGCDAEGHLESVVSEGIVDGGAYAGYAPNARGTLTGLIEDPGYRIGNYFASTRLMYTNKLPKANMRAPGSPQFNFAFESALDELALKVGITPVELRERNLLREGEHRPLGHHWSEYRGRETLDAALAAMPPLPSMPDGWVTGQGLSIHDRHVADATHVTLRLSKRADGGLRVEIGTVETGTGSHTVMRNLVAEGLGLAPDEVEVVRVSSANLPRDPGVGGSSVTVRMAHTAEAAITAWKNRSNDDPMLVDVDLDSPNPLGSYGVQIAQVAVDTATGQIKVFEILTAVDVAEIVNEKAHQMQIDGGTLMGYGFACLEDLDEKEGQVWAANLGEFKISSQRDAPNFRTVLVRGGQGVGEANVKPIGELTTPPTPAAIANAVFAATDVALRAPDHRGTGPLLSAGATLVVVVASKW